jgi:hypothetical protein
VSEAAAVLVRDGLPEGVALADLGVHRLKDLGRPEQIFQLTAAALPGQFPPLRSLGTRRWRTGITQARNPLPGPAPPRPGTSARAQLKPPAVAAPCSQRGERTD